ncbi:MAG: DNA repair protein RadA [Phycisphaerae bacterium]|nr:MAG: DNA repair protein RadA [Phycisphaerae bacterium]
MEEAPFDPASEDDTHKGLAAAIAGDVPDATSPRAALLADLRGEADTLRRLPTGIHELDRVLGGSAGNVGLVPGSAVLIGGEPGIGKSTLMLHAACAWAAGGAGVLYVSSEESAKQIALRAQRLQAGDAARPSTAAFPLHVLADTNLARIIEQARRIGPKVLILDSIQMIYKPDVPAGPGSVTQLRRCAAELVYLAKASGVAVVLVGHVTKDGQLAGPRLLEHLVDTVLTFDGDRHHAHRIVRAVKNRFGTTQELGLFEMTSSGLRPLPEGAGPAATDTARPGSALAPIISGTRCLMVEVQALTATGFLGAAKRKASGLDPNRLAMIIAVLEQHAGLRLADRDIFASSVGGVRMVEPAGDLALLLAIAGAHYKRSLPPRTACAGEVGLGGEVRPVPAIEQRVREAARLGYARLLLPPGKYAPVPGVAFEIVRTVDHALQHLS